MRNFKSKNAFTLAEVLITLGIIGVVAAMTLPTLITNVQKQTLAVATRKFHSNISNAIQLYMTEAQTNDLRSTEMCYDENDEKADEKKAQEAVHEFIREHFKVVKECDSKNADMCFAKKYLNYKKNGNEYPAGYFAWWVMKVFVLSDGTVLSISYSSKSNGEYNYVGNPVIINVDVNGQKGPNIIGYDMWSMAIYYDGSVDESNGAGPSARKSGTLKDKRESSFIGRCGQTYGGCFGHFLNNNYKFDY